MNETTTATEATDKNGDALGFNDICIYVPKPDKRDPTKVEYAGKRVIVRAIKPPNGVTRGIEKLWNRWRVRVDDELDADDASDQWSWASWVEPDELVRIGKQGDQ